MTSLCPSWQQSLDADFVQRLNHPLTQPGVVNNRMARTIIERSSRLHNRLPLLAQQMQRWSTVVDLETEQTPIVYVQSDDSENKTLETRQRSPGFLPSDTNQEQKQFPLRQAQRVQVSNSSSFDNITTGNAFSQPDASDQPVSNPLTLVKAVPVSKHDALQPLSAPQVWVNNQAEPALTADAQLTSLPVVRVKAKSAIHQQSSIVKGKTLVRVQPSAQERSHSNKLNHIQPHSTHPQEVQSIGESSATNSNSSAISSTLELIQPNSTPQIQRKLDQVNTVKSQPLSINSAFTTPLPVVKSTQKNVAASINQQTETFVASDSQSDLPILQIEKHSNPNSNSINILPRLELIQPNSTPQIQRKLDQVNTVKSQPLSINSAFTTPLPVVKSAQNNIAASINHHTETFVASDSQSDLPILQIEKHSNTNSNSINILPRLELIQPNSTPQIQRKLDQVNTVKSQPLSINSAFTTPLPVVKSAQNNIAASINHHTETFVASDSQSDLPILQIEKHSNTNSNSINILPRLELIQPNSTPQIQRKLDQVNTVKSQPLSINSDSQLNKLPIVQLEKHSNTNKNSSTISSTLELINQTYTDKSNKTSIHPSTANKSTGKATPLDAENFRSQHLKKRSPPAPMSKPAPKPIPLVQVSLEPSSPQLEPLILSQMPIAQQKAVTANNISSTSQINSGSTNSQKVFSTYPQSSTVSSATSQSLMTSTSSTAQRSQATVGINVLHQVDIDRLAEKIERKLSRKIMVESERRGIKKWH